MKPLQNTKLYNAIPPAVIKDDAAFDSYVIDTAELNYGEFHVLLGATDIAPAVFRVMESDTKTDSTTLGGTPAEVLDVATKPGAGSDNGIWVIGLDLTKARKRYIQLQVTAGDGTAGTYLAASFVSQTDGEVGSAAANRGDVDNAEYV